MGARPAVCVSLDAKTFSVDTDVAVPPDSLRIITTISVLVSYKVRGVGGADERLLIQLLKVENVPAFDGQRLNPTTCSHDTLHDSLKPF